MEQIQLLARGTCPVCNRIIMNEQKTAYNEHGMEFFVKWHDGSIGSYGICKQCFATLTQEQIDAINSRQITNWGDDIKKQLQWYYLKAVHLKVEAWAKTKEEVKNGL